MSRRRHQNEKFSSWNENSRAVRRFCANCTFSQKVRGLCLCSFHKSEKARKILICPIDFKKWVCYNMSVGYFPQKNSLHKRGKNK